MPAVDMMLAPEIEAHLEVPGAQESYINLRQRKVARCMEVGAPT